MNAISLLLKLAPEDADKLSDLCEAERMSDEAPEGSAARTYRSETIRRLIRRAHKQLPRKEPA